MKNSKGLESERFEKEVRKIIEKGLRRYEDHLKGNIIAGEDFEQAFGNMVIMIEALHNQSLEEERKRVCDEFDMLADALVESGVGIYYDDIAELADKIKNNTLYDKKEEPKSYFDLSDEEKKQIIETAAKESNEMQRKAMENYE